MSLSAIPTAFSRFPCASISGPRGFVRSVYVSDKEGAGPTLLDAGADETCMLAPTKDPAQIDQIFVFAAPGAGKSHWVNEFSKEWRRIHGPSAPIIIISQVEHDVSLPPGGATNYKRISVKSLASKELSLSEFEGGYKAALVIFDDVDALGKDDEAVMLRAQSLIISQGRCHGPGRNCNISCIVTSHVASSYSKTRLLLSSASAFVCFSHGCSYTAMARLLSVYGGLDSEQIQRLRKLPSRWFVVSRRYPPFFVSQKQVGLLHAE